MAAGTLSAPGTKYGPCKKTCKHLDCAKTRLMADELCRHCLNPIGYEVRFYQLDDKTLVHAHCIETENI